MSFRFVMMKNIDILLLLNLRKEVHKEERTWYMLTSCECASVDARFPYFSDFWCRDMKFIKVKAETCHINIPTASDTLLINNIRDLCSVIAFFSSPPTKNFLIDPNLHTLLIHTNLRRKKNKLAASHFEKKRNIENLFIAICIWMSFSHQQKQNAPHTKRLTITKVA